MTPVYITNFNNLERGFRRLTEWLCDGNADDIIVIDNASTYPPLLSLYAKMDKYIEIIRNKENLGPYAFWILGLHKQQTERFVVTDPDVVPSADCPSAQLLIEHAGRVMDVYSAGKVGPSLRIDNLLDCYAHKQDVIHWEWQFWERPVENAYHADIDTTFCLYEAGSECQPTHSAHRLRLAPPYSFEHVPWYEDSSQPNPERDYYLQHIDRQWTHWSVK